MSSDVDLCLMIEGQEGVTWPQWVALARACEDHGVPALFRSDHYLELAGSPFPPTAERMEVLEEQLQVILGSWSDGPFTFDGRHYSPRDLDARPKTAQRPHPPIILGGNAGPRSAALAARYADEYNTVFATPDEVRERRAAVERACEAAGREPLPFSLMTGVLLGRDRGELQERAERLAGLNGGDAAAFLARPPSGWIVGTLDEAAAQIAALRDAGVSRIMCQHLLHDDLDAVALIGRELPALLAA
jgi:alkanesulfonate monooxygenase SsuD/methylene tetrahydromethanopterin reductase-like flavin-dependent oxidoreductase (luciferase family)